MTQARLKEIQEYDWHTGPSPLYDLTSIRIELLQELARAKAHLSAYWLSQLDLDAPL